MRKAISPGPPDLVRESVAVALDPKIEKTLRELTSSRLLEILLVRSPGRSCDSLLAGLAARGHRVVTAKSSKQALENFYRQAFDLVICENGFEGSRSDGFAAYVRTLDPRQRIVIIGPDPQPRWR